MQGHTQKTSKLAISTLLTQNDTLEKHTAIPVLVICALTELCLQSTYFSFEGAFFRRMDHGFPFCPQWLCTCSWNIWEKSLKNSNTTTKTVGQIVWPHIEDELETTSTSISRQPSIEFTREKGRLCFWTSTLKKGKISTRVYRKSTHTDRYINYSSHHHPCIKAGVIAYLEKRAEKVCDKQCMETEISH